MVSCIHYSENQHRWNHPIWNFVDICQMFSMKYLLTQAILQAILGHETLDMVKRYLQSPMQTSKERIQKHRQ